MSGQVTADRLAPGQGHVYVHFPWCLAKCPYCDFVSYAEASIDHTRYADAVLAELDARARDFPGLAQRRIDSVFFGGGTPSLWDAEQLGRVLAGIRARLDVAAGAEVTVECNPTSIDEERARALVGAGVGRLSIGVQSLDDARLRFLGRLHDARGAQAAVLGALRAAPRVSADVIFGLPGQTAAETSAEVLRVADFGVAHLSAYQLTIEPGTRFGELARRGRLPLAEDGEVAEAFLAVDEALTARGFRHYEVSNYARPGEEALHNLGYWQGDEYLGLGCGAYGFLREARGRGIRWRNSPLPDRYMTSALSREPTEETREKLDAQELLRERIMLGLRLESGIDLDAAARDLGLESAWTPARERAAAWLEERRRVVRSGSHVRIPKGGWLWTDDTAARLF